MVYYTTGWRGASSGSACRFWDGVGDEAQDAGAEAAGKVDGLAAEVTGEAVRPVDQQDSAQQRAQTFDQADATGQVAGEGIVLELDEDEAGGADRLVLPPDPWAPGATAITASARPAWDSICSAFHPPRDWPPATIFL